VGIGDYMYIAIMVGIPIIEVIAIFVWLYKDGGILHVLKFIVAVALVCAAACYITR